MTGVRISRVDAVLPLDETLAAIRAAAGDVLIVVVPAGLPAVERAMLIAAIGPLVIELAPARRLCALDVAANAIEADVVAAIEFLARAGSTTGQVLAIG